MPRDLCACNNQLQPHEPIPNVCPPEDHQCVFSPSIMYRGLVVDVRCGCGRRPIDLLLEGTVILDGR